jgi:hypothetical protein
MMSLVLDHRIQAVQGDARVLGDVECVRQSNPKPLVANLGFRWAATWKASVGATRYCQRIVGQIQQNGLLPSSFHGAI